MKTFATVCSGIGAPEVAMSGLDWNALFGAEIEAFPNAVRAHHFPTVPNYGDLTKFHEWPKSNPDVLIAGCPCQSFSVAGLRKGLADPRGNLTLAFLAVIERFAPRWVLYENVPGILSDKTGAFGAFLGGLVELGYGIAYRILDAQHWGVPQRRRRVFVVGHSGGLWQRAAAVLFERQSLCGDSEARSVTRKITSDTLEAGIGRRRGAGINPDQLEPCSLAVRGRGGTPQAELGDDKANALLTPNGGRGGIGCGAVLAPTIPSRQSAGGGLGTDFDLDGGVIPIQEIGKRQSGTAENGVGHGKPGDPMFTLQAGAIHGIAHSLRADGFDGSEDGTGRGTPLVISHGQANAEVVSDGSPSLTCNHEAPIVFTSKDSGSDAGSLSPTLRAGTHSKSHANGGCAPAVCSPITAGCAKGSGVNDGKKGAPQNLLIHSMAVRRLTPLECEKLQGFPPGYTAIEYRGKPACDGPRYKALGNSMAVPVISWIGNRMDLVDGLVPIKT